MFNILTNRLLNRSTIVIGFCSDVLTSLSFKGVLFNEAFIDPFFILNLSSDANTVSHYLIAIFIVLVEYKVCFQFVNPLI